MIKTHCDHCAKIVEDHVNGIQELSIAIGGYVIKADLCWLCLGQLISTVEAFVDMADYEPEGSAKNETD